jgi:hypothetical protein
MLNTVVAVHELTSARPMTFADAVGEIATPTGREIRYVPISVEECAASADDHGALVLLEEQTAACGMAMRSRRLRRCSTPRSVVVGLAYTGSRPPSQPATSPVPTAARPTGARSLTCSGS